MGKMSYGEMQGHTVLVGWQGRESARLVQLLLSDTNTDNEGIALVAAGISENPLPDQTIVSIDYRSAMANSAPFLVAITLE